MAAVITCISALVRSNLPAANHPSTYAGLRAPTIAAVIPGHASVQATAMARATAFDLATLTPEG
jgi:hypothetical protein